MENLKKEDLVEGEIYTQKGNGYYLVFRYSIDTREPDSIGFKNYLDIVSEKYAYYYNLIKARSNVSTAPLRDANPEEKAWLEACENAGKFVKKDEVKVKEVYEIY